MTELNQEIYKTIFETWRYEVNSYWQRNSYFAAFEVAALAGCWHVVEQTHLWSGLAFSIVGLASTIVWVITSVAVHRYIDYWWESIKHIESKLSLMADGYDFALKHPGSRLHPSRWVHGIPVLFMAAWVVIIVFAIRCLCSCKGC